MNSLVSVIIPVFNVKPYLVEALDSVVRQSYENLEIIIVDDGSTDGSAEICDGYAEKDERVRLVHQTNQGLSAARNTGLDMMSGDVVAFLDSDDAYHHGYVKAMMAGMMDEQSDVVICRFSVHDTTGNMSSAQQKEIRPSINHGIYDRNDALRSLADGTINTGVWNKLYKSELWRSIRFPKGHLYEDRDTTFRILAECKKVSVLHDVLYYYRERPGSITDNYSARSIRDWLLSSDHFESFIEKNIPDIFENEHLIRIRQSRIKRMISDYLWLCRKNRRDEGLSIDLRKQIIETKKDVGLGSCRLRVRLCYWMIRVCPWALKTGYPLYHSVR